MKQVPAAHLTPLPIFHLSIYPPSNPALVLILTLIPILVPICPLTADH